MDETKTAQMGVSNRVTEAILKLVVKSNEHESSSPEVRLLAQAYVAASTSAGISGDAVGVINQI
jgi:hypothetical protein